MINMDLSEHFTLAEMTVTEVRADNTPGPHEIANLQRLARSYMEPLRDHFGPIRVNSAFRSLTVNTAIGGSLTSAHMDARACDFTAHNKTISLKEIVEHIIHGSGLDFDQVIYEFGRWVHIGIAQDGHTPRKQALMIFHPGAYQTWDPTAV